MPRRLPDFRSQPLTSRRLPDWLKRTLAPGHEAARTDHLLKEQGLHTICESGRCPNRDECYSQKTATFMILGDVCTRTCRFCSVTSGRPGAPDPDEPRRLAEAAAALGLRHVVITSVNRDDLEDEGASQFAAVIRRLREQDPAVLIEILTPDFKRTQRLAVRMILDAGPDLFDHNVETIPRLYHEVRPQAHYETSLQIFREIRRQCASALTKSGLMLGMGETRAEVLEVLGDLRAAGCDMVTLGQYLQSSASGLPVREFITPDAFADYRREALRMGFRWVESAPYVRSSYHAKDSFESLQKAVAASRSANGAATHADQEG